jgi:hypothetical protein
VPKSSAFLAFDACDLFILQSIRKARKEQEMLGAFPQPPVVRSRGRRESRTGPAYRSAELLAGAVKTAGRIFGMGDHLLKTSALIVSVR